MSYRRFIPRFNILDFGAHADSGVTDNTPFVVAALEACVAAGRGVVEVTEDPENPTGFYDMQSPGATVVFPPGTDIGNGSALFGIESTGTIPRIRMNHAIGVNNWLTLAGTRTIFRIYGLAFFADVADTVTACQTLMEIVGCHVQIENTCCVEIGTTEGNFYIFNSTTTDIRRCLFAGGFASPGYGRVVTFDAMGVATVEDCQILDSLAEPESEIRFRDPIQWPNLASIPASLICKNLVFGENANYQIHVEPVTAGMRVQNVEIDNCDFQPHGPDITAPNDLQTGAIWVKHTETVKIRGTIWNWQTTPMQQALHAEDAGDIEIDSCVGEIGNNGPVPPAWLGVRRIYTDGLTRSLKIRNSAYCYLDTTCPDVQIIQGTSSTQIAQDNTGGVQRVIVDDTIVRSVLAVAGGGGTGTAGILATPGAVSELSVGVLAAEGATDVSVFSAEAEATVSNVSAACHVAASSSSTLACDPAYQAPGPVDSSIAVAVGAGGTADQAVVTVTNQGTLASDFRVETKRRRVWPAWQPGLLLDVFGSRTAAPPIPPNLIAGWYDHSTLVNTAGKVATWKDRSGQHNDLTAIGAAQPVYTPVGNAGLPEADFAGAQVMTAAFAVPFQEGGTIFTVGTFTGDNQTHAAVAAAAGAFGVGDSTLWRQPLNEETMETDGGASSETPASAGWHSRLGSFYDNGTTIYIDGALATALNVTVALSNVGFLTVGDREGGGFPLTGSLQLVMIFTQALPVTLIAQLAAWARAIYGTP
jgi:hypothetical protein